ncbi:ATP-dependent DNA helicase RecG [Spirosoma rhododendri]|uniref:ATP-dependent DNA helicase RecG n=1 Tax=Spirosoma rhododendri TaxID=2728024 RepID=A0A7L5DSB3_9BACT|nr:ATP-dependent DNA helicase RecG [Spirosoma rhododendri]QJD81349.1 ATP-dependent DNA helicase RecG [Spirosoma rhododendri]
MTERTTFFDTPLTQLRSLGPQRTELINKELNLFTFGDLIQYYPFRYDDRSRYYTISELMDSMSSAQVRGRLREWCVEGEGPKKRLVGTFTDGTGTMSLVWFQGIAYIEKTLRRDGEYIAYGKPQSFSGQFSIIHPELENTATSSASEPGFYPVYNLTEKLRKRHLDSKAIGKVMRQLLELSWSHIHETLPADLIEKYRLISKRDAIWNIHLPQNQGWLKQAQRRLKFEELFYNQLRLIKNKLMQKEEFPGQVFRDTTLMKHFYNELLPFELTGAQQRVIRELYADFLTGKQMNRLLQGDVGSGKTIVAFIACLMAIGNGAQACLMAPTEILADQHYNGLKPFADAMGLNIGILTGSTNKKRRVVLHDELQSGKMHILVGTHALLEDAVQYKNLGLCIIDEQHRFGVAQRAKLWGKNETVPPHILVMTATPIPRTLAMTLYGNLDVSTIDELPKGRKPIKTVHKFDKHRSEVFGFMRQQLELGRQVYVVYPLIEESEKLDYKDLMDGYESMQRAFPRPTYEIGILHGKMLAYEKDDEMKRFLKRETQILVATTVIEVGVNVPNASVMVIESAERFGLSQLHQLRGRVGRGAEQSYCIMMTGYKLSSDTRTRLETMVRTNNGFEIADVDLQLRGPGDLTGTQQSGVMDLMIADLAKDGPILTAARESAQAILAEDPELVLPQHAPVRNQVDNVRKHGNNWGRIS